MSNGAPSPAQEHQRWRVNGLFDGFTYAMWHPFTRGKFTPHPEPVIPGDYEGRYTKPSEQDTWIPGWRFDPCGQYGEDTEEAWDGAGLQLRTVVSIHKPGLKYPPRVFYTRQWQDPDGRTFGKSGLRITTADAFRRWAQGERWPNYSPAHKAQKEWLAATSEGNRKDGASPKSDAPTPPQGEA